MFATVLAWLGNLLGGPFAKAAVDAYRAKLSAENTSEKVAADLAGRELIVQQREIEAQQAIRIAEIGKWWEPSHLAEYIWVAFVGKVVVWDTMLGLGSTASIHGDVGVWLGWIGAFLFGKRGFENVARILKR